MTKKYLKILIKVANIEGLKRQVSEFACPSIDLAVQVMLDRGHRRLLPDHMVIALAIGPFRRQIGDDFLVNRLVSNVDRWISLNAEPSTSIVVVDRETTQLVASAKTIANRNNHYTDTRLPDDHDLLEACLSIGGIPGLTFEGGTEVDALRAIVAERQKLAA